MLKTSEIIEFIVKADEGKDRASSMGNNEIGVFANFYWRFIQDFSQIAVPFTLILRISRLGALRFLANLTSTNESNIINKIGRNSKIRVKKYSSRKNYRKTAKSKFWVKPNHVFFKDYRAPILKKL